MYIVVPRRSISNRQDHSAHLPSPNLQQSQTTSSNYTLFPRMYHLQHYLSIMGFLGTAAAICSLPGGPVEPAHLADFPKSKKLCVPQGEGWWTFAMWVGAVEVPAPVRGGASPAGFVGDSAYLIYDNTCTLRGAWETSPTADCAIPYTIEANFLQDVLTIKEQTAGIGSPYFEFLYGNGEFSIGNNHCGCQDMSQGLFAEAGCKCAFPVDGTV
jgi:hypothetical protein